MPKSNEELEKELAALREENATLRATNKQVDEEEKLVLQRISLSGGVLSHAQAREIVRQQREWDAHPENPANAKKEDAPTEVDPPVGETDQDSTPKKSKQTKK